MNKKETIKLIKAELREDVQDEAILLFDGTHRTEVFEELLTRLAKKATILIALEGKKK